VSEREISAFLGGGAPAVPDLLTLQQALRCGTECGSCVPELKQLVAAALAAA
jgi:assimilatory nitrate reductase catalytic subunit